MMLAMLLTIVLVGVVIGLVLWLVSFVPMDARLKTAISGIAVAIFVIWALLVVLGQAPLPRWR
jgi:hypothetical protein